MSRYHSYNPENKISGPTPDKGRRVGTVAMPPERTAQWPGLPGKAQGKSRTNGVKKVKVSMYQVGL